MDICKESLDSLCSNMENESAKRFHSNEYNLNRLYEVEKIYHDFYFNGTWESMKAARRGDWETLSYAYIHNIPWDGYVMMGAAQRDDVKMMQWLHDRNCPFNSWVVLEAADNESINALDWLYKNNYPITEKILKIADKKNSIKEWIVEHNLFQQ